VTVSANIIGSIRVMPRVIRRFTSAKQHSNRHLRPHNDETILSLIITDRYHGLTTEDGKVEHGSNDVGISNTVRGTTAVSLRFGMRRRTYCVRFVLA